MSIPWVREVSNVQRPRRSERVGRPPGCHAACHMPTAQQASSVHCGSPEHTPGTVLLTDVLTAAVRHSAHVVSCAVYLLVSCARRTQINSAMAPATQMARATQTTDGLFAILLRVYAHTGRHSCGCNSLLRPPARTRVHGYTQQNTQAGAWLLQRTP